MKNQTNPTKNKLNRRDFIRTSAALGAATLASPASRMFAAGTDKIRIAVIGCGGRGTHDTTNCLKCAENVELVAMGDLFADRLERCRRRLTEEFGEKVKVTNETCFTGWDAHNKLLAID